MNSQSMFWKTIYFWNVLTLDSKSESLEWVIFKEKSNHRPPLTCPSTIAHLARDGVCDEITNDWKCDFDGGDCCADTRQLYFNDECSFIRTGYPPDSKSFPNLYKMLIKGLLFSKCSFGVFKSPKKSAKSFPGFLP